MEEAKNSKKDNGEDGWDPELNQDEAIMEHERRIEKEIAQRSTLVGPLIDLSELLTEYKDDQVYQSKIQNLRKTFHWIRRTRPDGNCFFRAFAFAYFETLLKDMKELDRFISFAAESKQQLFALGFPSFAVEDFYDCFAATLQRIKTGEVTQTQDLIKIFNDQGLSDYLIVYLRLITSSQLQSNSDFYVNFIDGERSLKEFCAHEVEPMYKESDHIHIIALTTATNVAVKVAYLNRGEGSDATVHNFPEDGNTRIHLIYRPGHYDIIYTDNMINSST